MNLLHLCFLCNEYPPGKHGGIGSFTRTLARALAFRGHRVTVLGFANAPHSIIEDDGGVRVHRLPHTRIRGLGFWFNGARLRHAIRTLHTDTPISLLEGPENAFATIPKSYPGRKIIRMNGGHHFFATTLGDHPRPWRSWLERRSFAHAHHLCAVSRFVAGETRRLLGLGDLPIEILPNPVDTSLFRPLPAVPTTPGLILFVGTLCEKKGIRQLVQAMPKVLSAVPSARLLACGGDSRIAATGRSYRDLLEATMTPETRTRITFADHVDNSQLPRKLAAAAVLVYPSHMEAHPIAWLEGMAMAKPIVASRTGPGPEVIQHGTSGLLCDPHDPNAIAQSVIRLLRNGTLAERLGAAARQRAVEEFSLDGLVLKNEAYYHACLEQSRVSRNAHPGSSPPIEDLNPAPSRMKVRVHERTFVELGRSTPTPP